MISDLGGDNQKDRMTAAQKVVGLIGLTAILIVVFLYLINLY